MTRLTPIECEQWFSVNHFEEQEDGHHFFPAKQRVFCLDFTQTESSRGMAILANEIAITFENAPEVLLYVDEWMVWPSEELPTLFARALTGYEDPRPLIDAPGFRFSLGENNDLRDFIRLALISGWDAAILAPQGTLGYALTNDDWLSVYGDSKEAVMAWYERDGVQNFEPKILWQGEA